MIGETVGNFTIVSRLGHGGMGEVFLGEQKSVKTRVAIKTLLPHISARTEYVQRFFNEAVAVSRIKHSGIAKIFDVGFLPSGQAYLVMEFLDGETLSARIQREGPLPLSRVTEIGRQISNILEATHQAGITHRDLKPDNIFLVADNELDSGERVKILDFGIAKLGETGMTGTSVGSMGTPAYMAPEQWRSSKNVDWRADAYSLGCVVFEMATGRPPFLAHSYAEACTMHLTQQPPRLRELVSELPAELEQLVASLLEKDPSQRPGALKDITREFVHLRQEPSPPVEPTRMVAPIATARSASDVPVLVSDTTLGAATGARHEPEARRGGPNRLVIATVGVIGLLVVGLVIVVASFRSNITTSSTVAQREHEASELPVPADARAAAATVVAHVDLDAASTPEPAPGSDSTAPPVVAPPTSAPRAKPHVTGVRPCPPVHGDPEGCDEVSCVLNKYEPACCCRFRNGYRPEPSSEGGGAGLPETLDAAMVASTISAGRWRINACGERSAAGGRLTAHVDVARDGHVTRVYVTDDSGDSSLNACVVAALNGLTFTRTRQGAAFAYPFAISGPSQAPAPAAPADGGASQASASTGWLLIGSKPPCHLYVDGSDTGLQTPQKLELSAGSHKITLVSDEFGFHESYHVDIRPGETEKEIKDYSDRVPK